MKGIVTEEGSLGFAQRLIARSLGIPCVIGAAGLMEKAADGMPVVLNADTGEIGFAPTEAQAHAYKAYVLQPGPGSKASSWRCTGRKATTLDGHTMGIYANIASAAEAELAVQNGCDGVGLFRTEFLYMEGPEPPSYEKQLNTYCGIARKLAGRPFVIRTLDAGGDKNIPYLGIGSEANPFLGFRAIRYCLQNRELFMTQISAILAVAKHPGVEMMLPMISTLAELRQAKSLVEEAKQEYQQRCGVRAPELKVGMMVETPSAAFEAERFAQEADFFSIGTNDLTQYLFAADRGNTRVSYLNSCYHPALLRLIRHVCGCGKTGIAVDICGPRRRSAAARAPLCCDGYRQPERERAVDPEDAQACSGWSTRPRCPCWTKRSRWTTPRLWRRC